MPLPAPAGGCAGCGTAPRRAPPQSAAGRPAAAAARHRPTAGCSWQAAGRRRRRRQGRALVRAQGLPGLWMDLEFRDNGQHGCLPSRAASVIEGQLRATDGECAARGYGSDMQVQPEDYAQPMHGAGQTCALKISPAPAAQHAHSMRAPLKHRPQSFKFGRSGLCGRFGACSHLNRRRSRHWPQNKRH